MEYGQRQMAQTARLDQAIQSLSVRESKDRLVRREVHSQPVHRGPETNVEAQT